MGLAVDILNSDILSALMPGACIFKAAEVHRGPIPGR